MTTDLGRARQLATEYVQRVNAGDVDELLALFAEDAVMLHPLGVFEGTAAIRGFYEDWVFAARVVVTLGPLAADGDLVFFELTAVSSLDPDATVVATVDVAETDDRGRIQRLAVYSR